MDNLVNAMSNEDLQNLRAKYPNEDSVTTLIDGILEARAKEEVQAKAKLDFEKGIAKLLAKLPHPDDVHNIYVRWAEVDVEDEGVEAVVLSPDVCKANDLPEGTTRIPTHKEFKWVVETNKGFKPQATKATSKRAITIYKHNPQGADEEIGNFPSYQKAADHLKIVVGGDSAKRAVEGHQYYGLPYAGSDITE